MERTAIPRAMCARGRFRCRGSAVDGEPNWLLSSAFSAIASVNMISIDQYAGGYVDGLLNDRADKRGRRKRWMSRQEAHVFVEGRELIHKQAGLSYSMSNTNPL